MVPETPPKVSRILLGMHLERPVVPVGFANVVLGSLGDSGGHAGGPNLVADSIFRGHPPLKFK